MRMRLSGSRIPYIVACAALTAAVIATPASAADLKEVAKRMVAAGLVKTGDKVLISGSVRDYALLEDLAVETMKAGGQPLITMGSEQLGRRSFVEVPESYDALPQTLGVALVNTFEVQLSVDVGETEDIMAGVPPARIATRAKAGLPVNDAFLQRGVRLVSLGNGLYPTAALASRLGMPQATVSEIFWKAVAVRPEGMRTKGEALRSALAAGSKITLTSANGTNLTFSVDAAKGFVSDGAITPEMVKRGKGATQTWLPAGELLVPVVLGTAEGKVVIDKMVYQGKMIEGLTLAFSKGTLTSMTAKSGLDELKAQYDASGPGKDKFSYIDVGLNPDVNLPTNTGRIVWMVPGGVTIGLGDNTFWGGTNVSEFGLAGAITAPTLSAGGKALIENGKLK